MNLRSALFLLIVFSIVSAKAAIKEDPEEHFFSPLSSLPDLLSFQEMNLEEPPEEDASQLSFYHSNRPGYVEIQFKEREDGIWRKRRQLYPILSRKGDWQKDTRFPHQEVCLIYYYIVKDEVFHSLEEIIPTERIVRPLSTS